MAKPTKPRQPVVYDMMLLAYAMCHLIKYEEEGVGIRHPSFCNRQIVFEIACIKIRALAQFMSAPKSEDMISIADPEFGGTADKQFVSKNFDSISKYVAHLQEQRWKKEYPRLKAEDILSEGKKILGHMKLLMDSKEGELVGHAKGWYAEFKRLYEGFLV